MQSDTGIYTQSVKSDCLAGGANPGGPTGPLCDAVKSNCWMTAAPTTNVLFRCVPSYNVTNTLNTICIYPNSNIAATGVFTGSVDHMHLHCDSFLPLCATDASCVIAQDNKAGTVQRPAKPNLLFDQLNSYQQASRC